MKIEYSSNNSGGSWWLSDDDWKALEKAGWSVNWEKNKGEGRGPFLDDNGERWLGAHACSAKKDFSSVGDAVREFEKVTGQDATDEGCTCCGPPHCFRWGRAVDDTLPKGSEYGYSSGEDIAQYLFKNAPKSFREALERLSEQQ